MKKDKVSYVFAYKYIWKNKEGKFCVKIITGVEDEHKNFMSKLSTSDDVICASRIYLYEICLNFSEQYEIVKREVK